MSWQTEQRADSLSKERESKVLLFVREWKKRENDYARFIQLMSQVQANIYDTLTMYS